jgi:FkbM family methyltransferase
MGDVALDIGANAGHYSRILRDRGCRVIAFEPNPRMAAHLRDNVADIDRNRRVGGFRPYRRHGVLYRLAARSFRQLRPSVQRDGRADGKDRGPDHHNRRLLPRAGIAPKMLKIDVEGNEPAVIMGAVEVIHRHRPHIIFEFWESWWNRGVKEIFAALNPLFRMTVAQTGEPAFEHYTAFGSRLDASSGMVSTSFVRRASEVDAQDAD